MKEYAERMDTAFVTMPELSRSQASGTYTIVGRNPLEPRFSYFGKLEIEEQGEVLLGTWTIGPVRQRYEGIGLLAGNMLAFTFKYASASGDAFAGVVLYEIVTHDVMRGYWTGFGTSHVGFEECRKEKAEKA
jgi:hypothetical protein